MMATFLRGMLLCGYRGRVCFTEVVGWAAQKNDAHILTVGFIRASGVACGVSLLRTGYTGEAQNEA